MLFLSSVNYFVLRNSSPGGYGEGFEQLISLLMDSPGFRNWFEEIWNADESDIDISDFENDENDDDLKNPSFAPLDLQYDSSSEEETKEEVSIVPDISIVDSVLEQKISCLSTVSITPKRFKREKMCKPSFSASSTHSPIDVPNISHLKIPEHSRRPYWKSLLSEEFNPLPPAPSFIENNRYLPVQSPEDYFHNHTSVRQFIKGKPNPCGLKIFVATAPDGLPLDFFIYEGSGDKIVNDSADNDIKELDTGGKVVLRLSENLPPGYFAIAASWIEYRRHKAMSSAQKFDYLAFRIKIQEYLFHGSEESYTSEYEPSEPPTPQKRKINAKVPLPSDHLRKKQTLHLPEIPQPASKNRCRMPGCKSNSARMRCTTCKVFLCMQEDRQCFKLFHEL
ncbi:piggyBac transposable element-derived protein 3 [Nephila pilipes]|uniref:PiggyBac transposable element-derived protein 3 n=1 Tax=Nephila pilipes TaxID=299642 RepID=A0A8X6PT97_NEPPI|nr:piggyBac transposable element-derived protein 3 [Nephila pilipes]